MPRKKPKFEDFIKTKEYKIWINISQVCDNYNLSGSTYITRKDIGGVYWEPLLDRIFKLGVTLRLAGKLKEIKMDWMRPLLYLEAKSDEKVLFDGFVAIVDKGAIGDATELKFAFKSLLDTIGTANELKEDNFTALFTQLKKDCKYYFTKLIQYVKRSYRFMHEHLKFILLPLRELRRSAYRLYALDKFELNNIDLTFFKDKKSLKMFIENIKDKFIWDAFKMKRDCDMEKLEEFLDGNINQTYYEYNFNNETRELKEINSNEQKEEFNPYDTQIMKFPNSHSSLSNAKLSPEEMKKIKDETDKHNLIYPNITNLNQAEPTQFRREALQKNFEEGLSSMIVYLVKRLTIDFPIEINTHKMFVNIKHIPQWRNRVETGHYLIQLEEKIEQMKQKLFEMKINGLSRVLIPITLNVEITSIVKDVYDLHTLIDKIMGNKLLHEQFLFFYERIKFLYDSTLKDQIEKIKNKTFMEEQVIRYLFFESMRRSVKIVNKMIKKIELTEKKFCYDDYYQIKHYQLEGGENIIYDAYEVDKSLKKYITSELIENQKKYQKEIEEYGRFWLMEGFFPPEDKEMWIEAIDMLKNINELVQEDIRDNILNPKKEEDAREIKENESKKKTHSRPVTKSSGNSLNTNPRTLMKKKLNLDKSRRGSYSSNESFDLGRKQGIKLDNLRPPHVWNFPVLKMQELRNLKLIREGEDIKHEIRSVNPCKFYRDKRVDKFLEKFNMIYSKASAYSYEHKNDKINYFFDKVLIVLNIAYSPFERFKPKNTIILKQKEEDSMINLLD